MYYYHVWVRSNQYRGKKPLTYSSVNPLPMGAIVRVPLQKQTVPGVIFGATKQPARITVKPVAGVVDLPALPQELLHTAQWLQAYYRSSIGAVTQTLVPAAIPQKITPVPDPAPPSNKSALPPLTAEQAAAINQFSGPGTYLLHGRTGSGKTRIYQELAQAQLQAGRSILILSPEISLTSQLANSFHVFGKEKVILLHSAMTAAERFKTWRQIAVAPYPLIIIGARSALFSPLQNLGLIIVDESHEPAYKQEQEPRYHASRVAGYLAKAHDATLVLGTATPAITDYFLAEQRQRPIIRLSKLALDNAHQTSTELVDLKDRTHFSKSGHISDQLIRSMAQSLADGEQSLLYLNRRGTARISLCQHCGWQSMCPNCDLPLTYHGDSHMLRCHVCNYQTTTPSTCPVCGHVELIFKSVGTKAIVDEVRRLFPDARISRFDSDNSKEERFENNYLQAVRGEIDILIGTQTLVKGLDLPLLSTLGVINADISLQMPDFTAAERTYQLINQVTGRVQRGHRSARAIIQTYEPGSSLLQSALEDSWPQFYADELQERKAFMYPPYCHLLKIVCRRKSAKSAALACEKITAQVSASHPAVIIDGPAPSIHEKFKDTYNWQLVIKAANRRDLLEIIDALPSTVTAYDLDPIDLL